jgi:hypothetical protein
VAIPTTWRHWRIDCRLPAVVAVRSLTPALAQLRIGNDAIAVVYPEPAGVFAEAIDFDLRRPVRSTRYVLQRDLAAPMPYRLDLGALDPGRLIATRDVPPVTVERRTGEAWTPVLTIPAHRLPGCTSAFN